ncbi:MAG TPA: hypothetical protein VKB81_16590 [Nitrospira sp.]|nr:hypothetical protein [Nitrospira sp.]
MSTVAPKNIVMLSRRDIVEPLNLSHEIKAGLERPFTRLPSCWAHFNAAGSRVQALTEAALEAAVAAQVRGHSGLLILAALVLRDSQLFSDRRAVGQPPSLVAVQLPAA